MTAGWMTVVFHRFSHFYWESRALWRVSGAGQVVWRLAALSGTSFWFPLSGSKCICAKSGVYSGVHPNTNGLPLCEVLSVRICVLNGTQVSGTACVFLWGLCLFFLCVIAPTTAWPQIIGFQWTEVEAMAFYYYEWTRGNNLLIKLKESHNIVEAALWVRLLLFRVTVPPSFILLYPSGSSDLLQQVPFDVVEAMAFLVSPQSAYVTGREKLEGSNVTPCPALPRASSPMPLPLCSPTLVVMSLREAFVVNSQKMCFRLTADYTVSPMGAQCKLMAC